MLTDTNNNELNAIREDLKRIEGKLDDLYNIIEGNDINMRATISDTLIKITNYFRFRLR